MPRRDPAEIRRRAAELLGDQPPAPAPVEPIPTLPLPTVDEPGGRAIGVRAPNQKLQLLLVWQAAEREGLDGLTDEEAAIRAGLLGNLFWKRCGELRDDDLIAWNGKLRKGRARVNRRVSVITDKGKAYLARRELA
jgi:hypothetical protein